LVHIISSWFTLFPVLCSHNLTEIIVGPLQHGSFAYTYRFYTYRQCVPVLANLTTISCCSPKSN
jgi:hypothetical protein